MFCKNCGAQIPDGKDLCEMCGQSTSQADNVQIENPAFAAPSFEPQPKKPKKIAWILIIIAAVVAALAVLVALNFSFVKGLFIKTFGSEEDYFKFVEKKALSEYVDCGTDMYGKISENIDMDSFASEVTANIQLGDKALSLIEENAGADVDLDWLKNFSFAVNTAIENKNLDYGVKFNIGDGTIFDIKCLLDMDKQDLYMGILNLSDKYIKVEGGSDTATNTASSVALSPELMEALPSDKEANQLLNKYLGIAIDSLGNVTKTSEKMEAGDYSQKVTVLKYELNQEDVIKMCKQVLKELKNDKKVKEYIGDFEAYMLEEYEDLLADDYKKGNMYRDFKDAIEELIDDLGDTDGSDAEIFTLVDYVNAKHEIIGREIEIDDESIVNYITIHKGSKFAFEAECESLALKIYGDGTDKNDKITGDYEVIVDGKELFTAELESFDTASLKKLNLNGSVKIIPSSDLLSSLFGTSSTENTVLSMLEPAIKLTFETNDNSSTIAVDVMSKDDSLLKLTINGSTKEDATVTLPDENAVMSSDEVMDWVDSFDLNKIVSALEAAKVPSEIVDVAKQYVTYIDQYGLSSLISSYYGYGSNYDYGYGSGYGYDYDYGYDYGYGSSYDYYDYGY